MSEAFWLPAAVVVTVGVGAAAQMLSGMGFALVAGPLLILALGHSDGVRISVVMSLVLNAVVLATSFRAVRWGDALRLFVPAALVVLPTLILTTRMGTAWVSAAAGAAVLLAVGLMAAGRRARWVEGPAGAIAAGAGSGVLNVIAGISGPPVALFIAHRGWSPRVSSATVQAYALPLNIVTLAALGLPVTQPSRLLWACLGLLLGAGAVWPLVDRTSPATIRALVLVLASVGGLLLVAQAFT